MKWREDVNFMPPTGNFTNHTLVLSTSSRLTVHSLVAIRRRICVTHDHPSARFLHRPTWSGVCTTSSCLFSELRKFSKSFALQRHSPFSELFVQVFSSYFRDFLSYFTEQSISRTRDILSLTLNTQVSWGLCSCASIILGRITSF